MEEKSSIFRQKSLDRISSPEQLNDYLRVTSPTVWVVLAAVILLLAGVIVWGSTATLESFATGTGTVQNGTMTIRFDDGEIARSVEAGMTVAVGADSTTVTSVGVAEDGSLFALARTTLADGSYPVHVVYKTTQVRRLLFN